MRRRISLCICALLGGIFLAVAGGCQSPTAEPRAADPTQATTTDAAPKSAEEKIAAAMAELPEADRGLAMAQKVCPVSDAPLGTMGPPLKVSVGARDVFICCDGCREELTSNPEKYLAKLPPAGQPADQ